MTEVSNGIMEFMFGRYLELSCCYFGNIRKSVVVELGLLYHFAFENITISSL